MYETYTQRRLVLTSLGFTSYLDYLETSLWNCIRKEVLHRDQCKCRVQGCKEDGVKQVHHLSYTKEVLLGIHPWQLVTLCLKHHRYVERANRSQEKLSLEKTTLKTLKLIIPNGKKIKRLSSDRVADWYDWHQQFNAGTHAKIVSRLLKDGPQWVSLVQKHFPTEVNDE